MEKRKRSAVHEAGRGEEKSQRKPRPQKTMPEMDPPELNTLPEDVLVGRNAVTEALKSRRRRKNLTR